MTKKARILIIEDEPDIIAVEEGLFQRESYEVDSALGGKAGLEKIRKGKYDIILLDIRMPDMSGREILDIMKKERIKTPVIVVTAVASVQTVRTELEGKYEISGFVSKPYLSNDLVPAIQKVLVKRK